MESRTFQCYIERFVVYCLCEQIISAAPPGAAQRAGELLKLLRVPCDTEAGRVSDLGKIILRLFIAYTTSVPLPRPAGAGAPGLSCP